MRYVFLVLLNLPVIGLAILNLLTRYKMQRISRRRFIRQVLLWIGIFVVLISSYPIYNLIAGRAPLSSDELSFFDIVQSTVIVFLLYVVNNQRQKQDNADKVVRDLHQELSIRLSKREESAS